MSNNTKRKVKISMAILILIIIGNPSTILLFNFGDNQFITPTRDITPESQGIVQDDYVIEWLDNPTFETPITPWYNVSEGDLSDINANSDNNQANYEILGEKNTFEFYSDLTQDSNWNKTKNPNFPAYPDAAIINASGAAVSHYWDEGADQSVAVNWDHMLSMPVNMSDYVITSANLTAIFNATVQATPSIDDNAPNEFTGAIDVMSDSGVDTNPTGGYFQGSTGDYVRFYVWISDPANNSIFEVAYNQTSKLGQDNPLIDHIDDSVMVTIPENIFIFYLTTVLNYNFKNFRISIGMRIWCEDNFGQDADNWRLLLIKSVNLTFAYEKNIDQFTSLSWNQIGNKISGSNIDINNATLNFKYKIDKTWTEDSPNSELRVYINNNQYAETIKLSMATSTFQEAKVGGFDVTNLILKDVNITLSIKVYLADKFSLDQKYVISIDNASLLIHYTKNTIEDTTSLGIFLNSQDKTLEKSIEVTMGDDVNVTGIYKDSLDAFIPNATVRLLGDGGPRILNESLIFNQYSLIFSSTELSIGNNFFSIEASKKYYESISELINIKVIERNTELLLFLDGVDKTLDKAVEMIYGNSGNITIMYRDTEQVPYTHIDGATVELVGIGNPQNFTEIPSYHQYFINIDTTDLGLGNSFLTVNAYKENYTTQSIRFKIEVKERNSYLDNIILNGIETTSIVVPWSEILSISVSFNDSFTDSFISGASVQLSGTGVSENFTENSPLDYNLNINTAILALGINFLTISANKENYTLSSRIISVSVTERGSKVDVYLNGFLSTNFEFYNISIGESLNITVFYKDLSTDSFISNANVRLIESGIPQNFTENLTFNQYNITIISDDLGVGVKFLTISAKTDNYTLSSEVITLIVNEKKTQVLLFLNGTQYYYGDTIQLEVTDTLNITVKYLDNITKEFLGGAAVDIINKEYFTENAVLEYYNLTLEIIDLNSTLNRIVIRAQVENYQTALFEFFIQIIERGTTGELFINGLSKTTDPYMELTVSSLLTFTIKYRDVRTGNHISGATIQLNGDLADLLIENITLEQYSLTINTSVLGVGLKLFTIIAEKANFESFFIQQLYVNVERIQTNITTTSGESTITIRPGEEVYLEIEIHNLNFSGLVKGAEVTYRWAGGIGFLTDNNGVYTATITGIQQSVTITINAYKGNEYDFTPYEIHVNVIIPSGELLLFQLLSAIGGLVAVALVTYLYLYHKIFKYPKSVRKVRKFSKTLKKTKSPKIDVTERKKAFSVEYQNEITRTSKLLKGKPAEEISKPPQITKDFMGEIKK
ncbi:MAG: hypothetical protein EAX91_01520 [Candidatus Lokiarchaeota archaeon]|nr:hypothetical protein [Candidatus Lokiarchaeota archaeon]